MRLDKKQKFSSVVDKVYTLKHVYFRASIITCVN